MNRFIVINPKNSWIQGDITTSNDADDAVRFVEKHLSVPTENEEWHVYLAPETFPPAGDNYSSLDKRLINQLKNLVAVLPNSLNLAPSPSAMSA